MSSGVLWAKRSRSRLGILTAIFAVTLLSSFLLAGTVGFLAGSAVSGVRATFADTPAMDAAVQLQTRLGDDPARQSAAADALAADLLAIGDTNWHRTLRADPVAVAAVNRVATTSPKSVILGSDPHLRDRTTLIDGVWPQGTGSADSAAQGTIGAAAAAALGIAVGDELELGTGSRVLVTGTWAPDDPADPYWFGDPAVASGISGEAAGPLIVEEDFLASQPAHPTVRWTLTLKPAITVEELTPLAEALAQLPDRASSSTALGDESVAVTGGLAQTVATLRSGVDTARAIAAIPLLLFSVIAWTTIAKLAGLLGTVRRSEYVLLRARGASSRYLVVSAGIEAAGIALSASAGGTALALAGLAISGTHPVGSGALAMWQTAAVIATVVVLVLGFTAWRSARDAARVGRGEDSGVNSAATTIGSTVLGLSAAALSLWQFLLYGSPIATAPDGSRHVDPVAALAPTLALVALSMLALLAFGPLVSLVQGAASRTRGIAAVLPGRQVGRRAGVFSVAVILVTLSVGGTTFAAAYASTWSTLDATTARLRGGSDVRVHIDGPPVADGPATLITSPRYAALDGAEAASPVLAVPVKIGDDTVSLTALSSAALPRLVHQIPGQLHPAKLADRLTASPGTPLPEDTRVLRVLLEATVAGPVPPGTVDSFAWLSDADGAVVRLGLGAVTLTDIAHNPATLSTTLPDGSAPWTVLAFEAKLTGSGGATGIDLTFDRLSGVNDSGHPAVTSMPPAMIGVSWDRPTGRVMTDGGAAVAALPVIVTDALARRIGAASGDHFSFVISTSGGTVDAIIEDTVPMIPAAGELGVLADLASLSEYSLRAGDRVPQLTDVWIRTGQPASVAQAAKRLPHAPARVMTAESQSSAALSGPVVVVFWWSTAGSLVLAVIGVLAMTVALGGARRGEVIVLRALGLTGRMQARYRLLELAAVLGFSLAFGALAGLAVSVTTVSGTARAAVSAAADTVQVPLGFATAEWAVLLGVFLVALGAMAAAYAVRVTRQAGETALREETR